MHDALRLGFRGWLDIEHGDKRLRVENAVSDNMAAAAAAALAQQAVGPPYQIRLGTGALWGTVLSDYTGYAVQDSSGPLAQFFTQDQTGNVTISYVLMGLQRVGTSGATMTARIYPAGSDVLIVESSSIAFNGLSSTAFRWAKFEFPVAVALPPGNYRIELATSGYTYSAAVTELQWANISTNPYAGGDMRYYNGSAWIHISGDPNIDSIFRAVLATHDQYTAIAGSAIVEAIDGYARSGRYIARFLSVFGAAAAGEYYGHASLEDSESNILAIATVAIDKAASEILRIYWSTEVIP